MTTAKTRMVAERLVRLGRLVRWKASRRPLTLSARVARMWNRAMTAPSNSVPDGRGGEGRERGRGREGREKRRKREARRGWCTHVHTYILHTRIYYIYNSLTNTPNARLPYTHDSPLPVLMVAGLKAFHTMVSQMLVAMKRDMLQEGGMQQETPTHTSPYTLLCMQHAYQLPLPSHHPPSPTHPDPSPYPFCSSSSSRRTTRPATTSWMMIRMHTPIPSSEGGPYIPVSTYTTA